MRKFLFWLLAMALPTMASAQAFEAVNRLLVVRLDSSSFEVIEARGEGPRGIWCAAADYALAAGVPRRAKLYLKTPRGASVSGVGRVGVTFTIDPASLSVPAQKYYSVSVRIAGMELPVNHAYQFCKDYLIELDDIF